MFNPIKLSSKHVDKVIKNGFRTSHNKDYNNLLIKEFCKKINVKYGVTVSSGTAGLHVALMSLNLKKNDEVIMPAMTMSAVAYAILLSGAKPIFADIDKQTLNIDVESVKKKINKKTKAIISVALFGLPPDYTQLKKMISKTKSKIFLIEDNAECVFSKHREKFAGTYGDLATFSFQSSKTFTCGGGILVTNNKQLYLKSKMYSNLGYYIRSSKYHKNRIDLQKTNFQRHKLLGFNYRLSELGAAVVYGQLRNSNRIINFRKKAGKSFSRVINNFKFVKTQKISSDSSHSFWAFPIIFENKAQYNHFKIFFRKNGGDYFYACWLPPYKEKFYKDLKLSKPICKNADKLQKITLGLKTNYYDQNILNKQIKALNITLNQIKNKFHK